VLHTLGLGFASAVLWLLLSGYLYNPLLLGLGGGSVVIVVYYAHRMDVIDHEGHPLHHLSWRAISYWIWLMWEIVVANFQIARVILSSKMPINPHLIDVNASQSTELGHVIYANSITLTPGTVTVDVEGGVLHVHALTQSTADGLMSGEMDRRVTDMEGLNAKSKKTPIEPTLGRANSNDETPEAPTKGKTS
jgi:multicomponent Na+:H+ antiporter subunit E